MRALDWGIVAALLLVLFLAALRTRRYTRTVSAFLVAERCGGRYLISMATAMAGLGVITLVYWLEMYYEAGYTAYWWGAMTEPALVILALSGWVVYRFRQTRAMTLAQFFEMRYSRRFRVFAGLVAYLSGIVNFGIFPSIGARFFMALCGLPEHFGVLGVQVSTFATIMLALLSIALLFTFLGGLVAVMLTDFIQGVFANVVFAAVIVYLLLTFSWEQIGEVMLAAPAGKSPIHPFDIGEQSHFNIWFFLISVVVVFYSTLGWQGTQGYNACAKDAHEAKMVGILNGWRFRVLLLVALVVPIAVRTLLEHPDFAGSAALLRTSLDAVEGGTAEQTAALRNQLRTPYALAVILPTGLLGLMGAAVLAAFISTHDTYLHSWGSIFVQDVILPFRRRPLTSRQHLWALRASILGVAVFVFLFSLLFRHTQYIAMFCAVTASIFVGGAGSVIIGGLYWKRGTTAGAWSAMIAGMVLSLTGIVIKQIEPGFVLTGQEMTFFAIVASIGVYVLVSLVGPRAVCDMDRLLHRGRYAVAGESSTSLRDARTWLERLGVDREFTGRDRVVTLVSVGWPLAWTALFVAGTAYNLAVGPENVAPTSWLRFWRAYTWTILAASIVVTIWFTAGGLLDVRYLFRTLRERQPDTTDDGRVAADDDPPDAGG